MSRIEDRIIENLDFERIKIPTKAEGESYGREAEKVVIEFLRSISGMEIRPATPLEDSGKQGIVKDLAIDAVGYLEEKPAIAFQITNSNEKRVHDEKIADILRRPFVRLSEMTSQDTAIPRVLVFADRVEVWSFVGDRNHDITGHPKLIEQIIRSVLNGLTVSLMKTRTFKNSEKEGKKEGKKQDKEEDKEWELIQKLITLFTESEKFFKQKAMGVSH